jgi:hypothetical protein
LFSALLRQRTSVQAVHPPAPWLDHESPSFVASGFPAADGMATLLTHR